VKLVAGFAFAVQIATGNDARSVGSLEWKSYGHSTTVLTKSGIDRKTHSVAGVIQHPSPLFAAFRRKSSTSARLDFRSVQRIEHGFGETAKALLERTSWCRFEAGFRHPNRQSIFEQRSEQRRLVRISRIQGRFRYTGGGGDSFHRHRAVAIAEKQRVGRGEEVGIDRCRPLKCRAAAPALCNFDKSFDMLFC
jgi:hypothetical protein